MTHHYENKLRTRISYTVDGVPWAALEPKERDALADAITALRQLITELEPQPHYSSAVDVEQMDSFIPAREALARLDAVKDTT